MRLRRSMLKFVVAALAVLTPVVATPATDSSQAVSVSIVNNTTTPAAGKDKPAGLLNINCGGGVNRVKQNTTRAITCTVTGDEALVLSYNDGTRTASATIDCGTTNPDFTDESQVTVTFTGSGAAITFTQSCTGLG